MKMTKLHHFSKIRIKLTQKKTRGPT